MQDVMWHICLVTNGAGRLALVMLFIGGIAAYTFVWDLGDVGIGLMTIFNIAALYLMGGQALDELKAYEESKK